MTDTHAYQSRLSWAGSTAAGYDAYDRTHSVEVPPADVELVLSSDPAFSSDRRLANPDQLLLVAASSCQLLMFLAIAAPSRGRRYRPRSADGGARARRLLHRQHLNAEITVDPVIERAAAAQRDSAERGRDGE